VISRFWRRLWNLLHRRQFERELAEEMEFHLQMKQAEQSAIAARREMGNLLQARENSRETWMFLKFETLLHDVRYASRILLKNPVFTASAVLTLALGIGANTAIFTLIDALLLRDLPVPHPERMVQLTMKGDQDEGTIFSYPFFEAVRDRCKSFSSIFTWNATNLWTGWGAQARQLSGAVASGEAYQTLGLVPEAGRLFTPSDDTTGAPFVAVISDAYWEHAFHRDPRAIGRTVLLNQRPFVVIGVTPSNFLGVLAGASPSITITVHASAALNPRFHMLESKSNWFLTIFARLKPGVKAAQARAELSAISAAVMKDQLFSHDKQIQKELLSQKIGLIPGAAGGSWLAKRYRKSLLVLICISGLVLLLTCANLASLCLSRVAPRQKELSVRLALGAARSRLVKQLLTESVLISVTGAVLGTLFAMWATRALVAFLSTQGSPLVLNLNPDWRMLLFLALLATGTGLLFGSVPAVQGTDLKANDALKHARIGLAKSGHRFQLGKTLVSVQVGLAVLLVTGAMLFVKTLENLKFQDAGFNPRNVVFLELSANDGELQPKQLGAAYDRLVQSMRRDPHVESAALSNVIPVSGSYEWNDLSPDLWPQLTPKQRKLYFHRVTPGYFRTVGSRLLRGRDFTAADANSTEKVALLSASAARTFFPNQDPIGQLLRHDSQTAYRIIGVVDDAKYTSLRDQSPQTLYLPLDPRIFCVMAVRATIDKSAVTADVRQLLKQTGKDIRLGNVLSLTEQIDQTLATERLIALLASFFAALAAVLVAIGLYGVVGYSAARRTSEIGVRLALGAPRQNVRWIVMREAVVLSALGILVGIPAALLCARLANSMLYNVKPSDPITLGLTIALILTVTALAAFVPALRASRLDPMRALRYE